MLKAYGRETGSPIWRARVHLIYLLASFFPASLAQDHLIWDNTELGIDIQVTASDNAALNDASDGQIIVPLTLGILEKKEGRFLEAVSYLQEALEQKPRPSARAEVNYRLAEIYVTLGKRDEAVGHLMTAVAQAPDGKWGKKSEEYLKILR